MGEELTFLKAKVMRALAKDLFKIVNSIHDANVVVTTHLELFDSSKWYILIKETKGKEESKVLPANVTICFPEKVMNTESLKIEGILIEASEQLKFRKIYYK